MNAIGYAWITSKMRQNNDTNPSLIPRKPTGIGGRYFLYRKSAQSDYLRKVLYVNEGEDREITESR